MVCDFNGQALIWKVNCIYYLISRAVNFSRILISKWRFSLGYLNSGKNNQAFLYLPLPMPTPLKIAPAVSHSCVTAWCSPGLGCSWTFRMRPQCFMLEAKFGCHWQHVFLSVLSLEFVATIFCLCMAIVMGWDGPLQWMRPLGLLWCTEFLAIY